MYVSSGAACTERNSQTPMDPRAITRQNWRVARVGNRFVRGNVALNTLVQQLGGVGIGDNVPGVTELSQAADFRNAPSGDTPILGDGSLYGGRVPNPTQLPGFDENGMWLPFSMGGNVVGSPAVPGSPVMAWAPGTDATLAASSAASSSTPQAVPAAIAPEGGSGFGPAPPSAPPGTPGGLPFQWWSRRGYGRARGVPAAAVCAAPPQLLRMVSVFPIPAAGQAPAPSPTSPAPRPPAGTTPATPAAAAPPIAGPAPTRPTTGNICLDLALNYLSSTQVSPNQLLQCSLKGYQGNKDGPLLTTAYVTWRNANYSKLPMVPDQDVPQFTPALGQQFGFSGLGQGIPGMSTAGLVLVAAGAGLIFWAIAKGMR